MENKVKKLSKASESAYFRSITYVTSKLIHGYFLFKRRKGEVAAGAATFFSLLSFCPSILLMISIVGYFTGDAIASKQIVLHSIKSNFPGLAPWIMESIRNIVNGQLNATTTFNVVNILFLAYSLLGLVSTFMYGLSTIYNRSTEKPGFLIEDIKSFFVGSTVAIFLTGLMVTTNDFLSKMFIFNEKSIFPKEIQTLFQYESFPIIATLLFVTLFYKLSSSGKATFKDSFIGAASFVSCFLLGKSFYWLYVNLTKAELSQSYGNFYTIVIAAMWIYFLVCSFFYGASVSCVTKKELSLEEDVPPVEAAQEELPPPLKKVS